MTEDEDSKRIARYRARVEQELAELELLQQSAQDGLRPVALDQQSVGRLARMDALQGQAMAAASDQRRVVAIQRLKRALARMEDGDYGYCAECGETIPDGRLDVDPSNPLCVSCAGSRN